MPRPDRIDDWREVLIVAAAAETGLVAAREPAAAGGVRGRGSP